jgi:hypothetical protein
MEAVRCGELSLVVVVSLAAQWLVGGWWVGGVVHCNRLVLGQGRPRGTVRRQMRILLLIGAPLLFAANVQAQDVQAQEKEPSAIVEIGGAGEWGLPGSFSFGPSAAVEFTPIRNWLEIEGGVSTLFGGGKTEWSTDLLFKKPFTLSDQVEFMVGVGPEWTFSRDGTKIAGEVAADFMFWPTPDRRYGWFVEPSYSYSFSQGHELSLSVSVGLLIAIP